MPGSSPGMTIRAEGRTRIQPRLSFTSTGGPLLIVW
jgi:hypothetical protein